VTEVLANLVLACVAGVVGLPTVAYLVCKLGRLGYLQGEKKFREMAGNKGANDDDED
jgi:hypothetical protein